MTRKVCVLAILAVLCLGSLAHAAWIDPNLQQALRSTPPDGTVNIYVTMHDRVDLAALTAKMDKEKLTRLQRHYQVITALQDKAYGTQDSLLAAAVSASASLEVKRVHPFWIANAVGMTVKPSFIDKLARRTDIESIYLDAPIELIAPVAEGTPDAGRAAAGIEPGISATNAPLLWDIGIDGTGTLACDQDTGEDGTHPAFASRWKGLEDPTHPDWYWFDPLNHETFPTDSGEHGTHTMGTMLGDDGAGNQIGMAPGAKWIGAKTIDTGGNILTDAVAGFEWMADPDGNPATMDDVPDVVNNSWGLATSYYGTCKPDFNDAIDAAEAAGVVVVFAAGNEGPAAETLRSPGNRISPTDPFNTFSVAALNQDTTTAADFSSRGPSDCDHATIKPEVAAVGVSVRSSIPGGQFTTMDGTSMATPHVAGAVLLLRQAYPDATVEDIKFALWSSAVDLGDPGEDNTFGAGRIDVYAAYVFLASYLVSSDGKVSIDANYSCQDTITVRVADLDLTGPTVDATVSSTTEPAGKTVTCNLTPTTGVYTGTIDTSPTGGPTTLHVTDGDTITATYIDANDGSGNLDVTKTDTATADCQAPAFAGLTGAEPGDHQVTLTWDGATDGLAVTYNVYRAETSGGQDFGARLAKAQTSPFVDQTAVNGQTYYYIVRAEDKVGNEDGNTVELAAAPVGPDWIFFDDFEPINLISSFADWTVVHTGTSALSWTDTNPGHRGSQYLNGVFAVADKAQDTRFSTMDEQLISPAINLSHYDQIGVAFGTKFVPGFGDRAMLDYSFDGTTWTNIKTFRFAQDAKAMFDVPALDHQPQVYLRFHYVAGIGGQYWGVDNVLVSGYPSDATTTTVPTTTSTTTTTGGDDDTAADDTASDDTTADDTGDDTGGLVDDTQADDTSDDSADDSAGDDTVTGGGSGSGSSNGGGCGC